MFNMQARTVNSFVIVAVAGFALTGYSKSTSSRIVLWKNGQDMYKTFVATVGHNGTCQPVCTVDRSLVLPPNVRYKVVVEAAMTDMRALAEKVEVRIGGFLIPCIQTPASDFDCSLAHCDQQKIGPVGANGLSMQAQGFRTRDTCKCRIEANGDVDCYSELLSGLDQTYGLLVRLTFIPDIEVKWVTGPWDPCGSWNCASTSTRTTQCFISNKGASNDVEVQQGSPSWHLCVKRKPRSSRKCSETASCISGGPKTIVAACHFHYGLCCTSGLCQMSSVPVACRSGACQSQGNGRYALLEKGRCENIGCSDIEDRTECEDAAKAFHSGAVWSSAALLITSYKPSFCVWEPKTINNEGVALWWNMETTIVSSTTEFRQLCKCGSPRHTGVHSWRLGTWSECSLSCGRQQRIRNVTCIYSEGASSVEVSPTDCLEANVAQPIRAKPCTTPACYTSQKNAKCGGKERTVLPSEVGSFARRIPGGGSHCVEMASAASVEEQSDQCRRSCFSMGDCVGFTLYESPRNTSGFVQCCFLQKATRWEENFRHAVCHLAHGVQTHSGCTCQVGWAYESASGVRVICGAAKGGCCTTTESGAVSWCPTTSSTCGARSQGQQRWDFCDPQGLAAITEKTCRTHPRLAQPGCMPAHSVSQCNQIATALGLPDTTPIVTLSMHMPSACVWQTAASQLWLNQLVGAVNATHPGKVVTVHATPNLIELCACPQSAFHWDTSAWTLCFRDPSSSCGRRIRSRHVFCIRQKMHSIFGGGEIVDDSFCVMANQPTQTEACTGCTNDVVRATVEFSPPSSPVQRQTLETESRRNFASAMSIADSRVRTLSTRCCDKPPLRVDMFVSGQSARLAGDAIERLLRLLRSPHDRSRFSWTSAFAPLMQRVSLKVIGIYRWVTAGDWSNCSVSCGGGYQYRRINCTFQNRLGVSNVSVDEFNCDAATKPLQVQICSQRNCRHCPGFTAGPRYVVSGGGGQMSHGSKVYVTCAAGSSTMDDIMLVASTCDDGSWTPLGLSCGRSCPPYKVASWKYVVKGTGLLHGATRHVWCKDQASPAVIELPPSATVVCKDGHWTRALLACTGDCQELELSDAYVLNGSEGGSYAPHGALRRVACAQGFNSSNGTAPVDLRCDQGSWIGREQIADCKADCPRYQLPKGYQVEAGKELTEEAPVGSGMGQSVQPSAVVAGSNISISKRPLTPSGVSHGSLLLIRCADGYGRVLGAVVQVQCSDGQWSTLSLVCQKNCLPFNVSTLDQKRYQVDLAKTSSDMLAGVESPSGPSVVSESVLHGSTVTIGCSKDAPYWNTSALASAPKEELRCENGVWSATKLQCFHDCPAFLGGSQYVMSLLESSGLSAHGAMVHGARVLATCAHGYSLLPNPNPSTKTAHMLIDESTCVDGNWTPLELQCTRNCMPLRLGPRFVVHGTGFKFGSNRLVSCAVRVVSNVSITCSEVGKWLILEDNTTSAPKPPLSGWLFDERKMGCMTAPIWSRLPERDVDLVMLLTACLCASLLSFICSCCIAQCYARRDISSPQRLPSRTEEELADTEESESPSWHSWCSNRTKDTFTRLGSESSVSNRLSHLIGMARSTSGFRTQAFESGGANVDHQDANMCMTSTCRNLATHMCFPCNHLALCSTCASTLLESSAGGAVIRCPACRAFVNCVIDAKPAPVFLSKCWRLPSWLRSLGRLAGARSTSLSAPNIGRSSADAT